MTLGNTALKFGTEMSDQALDGPRRRVSERTDGVAFDLLGHVIEAIDHARVAFITGERVAIREGLADSREIVADGAVYLDEGAPARVVPAEVKP